MITATKDPTVTIILFAFNQERFISEAVQSTFDQTYQPLNIILSDDCSSDRTFEIIQRLADDYRGPHKVTARQSQKNLGLLKHINEVVDTVDSGIVVMAAGDDISYPMRTKTLVRTFQCCPSAMAVLSDYDLTQQNSKNTESQDLFAESISKPKILFNGGGYGMGATYAYRKECFTWPSNLNPDLFSEDRILPLRACLLGKVYLVGTKLVFYRQSDDSLGARLNKKRIWTVTHEPHRLELKKAMQIAVDEQRVGRSEARYLLFCFRAHGFFANLVKKRGRPGDALFRIVARVLHKSFRSLFIDKKGTRFRVHDAKEMSTQRCAGTQSEHPGTE